ncbi:MAG: hypothetical protein F9K40_21485, partial [Kofleriaceae bacterium]
MLEGGAALGYYLLRPVPPPEPWTLTLALAGEGTGSVNVSLIGEANLHGRCAKPGEAEVICTLAVPVDRWTGLTVIRGEKATFEGWSGLEPHVDDVLSGELMMFRDRAVVVRFGKMKDEIEVAIETSPDVKIPQPPRPEDPFEAEKLEEPP